MALVYTYGVFGAAFIAVAAYKMVRFPFYRGTYRIYNYRASEMKKAA